MPKSSEDIIIKPRGERVTLDDFPRLSTVQRLWLTVFRQRCPHCGGGKLYAHGFELNPKCSVCGSRFEREAGSWTGAVVIAYTIGSLVGFGLWLYLWWIGRDFHGVEWLVTAVAVAAILATYRPAKAWWVWMLYSAGWVYPDTDEAYITSHIPPPTRR